MRNLENSVSWVCHRMLGTGARRAWGYCCALHLPASGLLQAVAKGPRTRNRAAPEVGCNIAPNGGPLCTKATTFAAALRGVPRSLCLVDTALCRCSSDLFDQTEKTCLHCPPSQVRYPLRIQKGERNSLPSSSDSELLRLLDLIEVLWPA
jgi:hypothetical protein